MNFTTPKKILISTILLTSILLTCSPLLATTISLNLQVNESALLEHKQIINQYISQLRTIQNRSYRLMQIALENPIQDIATFKASINSVNNDSEALRRDILEYQRNLLPSSFRYRDVLLLLNALNYTKNALFELELLPVASDNVERARQLENFFVSRAEGIIALNVLENILSEPYN